MSETEPATGLRTGDYDAVIVGGSLAGCATAILLGRAGRARRAWSRSSPTRRPSSAICSHFIQASAVPTLERLDLLEPIDRGRRRALALPRLDPLGLDRSAAGARRGSRVNLRRELLDPMVREAAAATPGRRAAARPDRRRLLRDGETRRRRRRPRPRRRRDASCARRSSIGADGRDSRIAELAGVQEKTLAARPLRLRRLLRGRAAATSRPTARSGCSTRNWAAAFPTDSGLTFYAAMATKDRLPEFKRDPEAALVSYHRRRARGAADPRRRSWSSQVLGKIDMPNRVRRPDRARAWRWSATRRWPIDPLFGVGCGWALPVGRMARRLGRPGAARRGAARARPEALPAPPHARAAAATP